MHFPRSTHPLRIRITGAVSVCALAFLAACDSQNDEDQTALLAAAAAALQPQSTASGAGEEETTSTPACATTAHCKMFVTVASPTVTGGIAGLDASCASDASKPSGDATYKALAADGTNRIACTTANCSGGTAEHTDWVLKPNKEYRRSDGTTVIGTTTANGIFLFPLDAAVQTAISGTNSTRTGLETNWTSSANDCANWSGTGGNSNAGVHDVTNDNLLSIGTSGCGNTARLICVEQ